MFKNCRFLFALMLGCAFIPNAFAAMPSPLILQNAQVYVSSGNIVGKITVCNTSPKQIAYKLRVENRTIDKIYMRDFALEGEACKTADLGFNRDFTRESRVGDNLQFLLRVEKEQGNIPAYSRDYSSPYPTRIEEHYTAYSLSKSPPSVSAPSYASAKPKIPVAASYSAPKVAVYSIRGAVKYDKGGSAANVLIQVMEKEDGQVTSMYTDRYGKYNFTNLQLSSARHYYLLAEISNYTRFTKPVDLRKTVQTIDLDLIFEKRVDFSYRYLPEGDRYFDNLARIDEGTAALYVGNDSDLGGFDFETRSATARRNGIFYFVMGSGGEDITVYTNNKNSGAIDLGEGAITAVRFAPYSGYASHPTRDNPLTLAEGHNYAVYDKKTDTYSVFHVDRITDADNMVYPDYSQPYYNAYAHSGSRDIYLNGRVVDEYGNGLSGIAVILYAVDPYYNEVATTYSNGYGDIDFGLLSLDPNKNYIARAFKSGMNIFDNEVHPAEGNKVLSFRLAYGREVDFSFKYNPTGGTSFGANDYVISNSARVFTQNEDYNNQAGYDFLRFSPVSVGDGAFYVSTDELGKIYINANNVGQGGVIDIGQGALYPYYYVPGSGYNRFGVEAIEGRNYAVYDQRNNIYAIIHIDRILANR